MSSEALQAVTTYAAEDEARDAALRLVERGIGATVVGSGPGVWELQVLPGDAQRACELLEVEQPEAPLAPPRSAPPWRMLVVIWLLALLTLPLLAFWITVSLAD